jgi:hypothetical protein
MAGLGYKLPGTTLEEVTVPSSVNLTSSQRTPCFIGVASVNKRVNYERVVRSSTGLTDSLAYTSAGIYEIIQVGSQKGLSDFVEDTDFTVVSDEIVWSSAGVVDVGATYFVSYSYVRPETDYKYKEFYRYEDVLADLGDDLPENPLVMISKIALKYFNVPKIAVVQVTADNYSGYGDALELIMYRDIQTVVPLTTNSQVRALVANHVTERSLPDNGRYRMAWFGVANGTPVGSSDDPTSICGIAEGLKNELCVVVNATRAKYYYNDPDTREELSTVVEGPFIAAVLAAYRDSFVYPATTLLNRTVPGIELYDDDYDDYYSEYMLTQAGGSSAFLVASVAGAMKVMDDLTTDNTTIERNNINIITAKHYIAKDVTIQMDRTFKGRLIIDSGSYINTVSAYLALMFAGYKKASVVEKVGTITVSRNATRRDTVDIFYSYYAVYTHKYTEGTYALEV